MLPLPQYKDMNLPLWVPLLSLCPEMHSVLSSNSIYSTIKTMETNSRSELTLTWGVSLYPRTNVVFFSCAITGSFHGTAKIVFTTQPALSKKQSTDELIASRAGRLCHSAWGKGITHRPCSLSFWVTNTSDSSAWSLRKSTTETTSDYLVYHLHCTPFNPHFFFWGRVSLCSPD